jgi:hypothetical protein
MLCVNVTAPPGRCRTWTFCLEQETKLTQHRSDLPGLCFVPGLCRTFPVDNVWFMDHCLPLLELPAPCLRSVLLALWPDPRDLAALSCCCKATAELCADQEIWLEVILRRYGPSALPGQAPEAGAQVWSKIAHATRGICSIYHGQVCHVPVLCPFLVAVFPLFLTLLDPHLGGHSGTNACRVAV